MNTSSTNIYPIEGFNIHFNTTYKGDEITLDVVSDNDRFTVLHNDKAIGHIKVGSIRHTWYVVDSNYTPPYLVDEIGNRIAAQYRMATSGALAAA
jgi:hypothetical protein